MSELFYEIEDTLDWTSYGHHLLIYRIKLIANGTLRRLAAENTVINYLSRHFDHRKKYRYRAGVNSSYGTFAVPLKCPLLLLHSPSAYIQ